MAEQQPSSRPSFFKRRYIVQKFQTKYAIGLAVFLFLYSVIPFALAFLIPYIGPAIKLFSEIPPEEQARAATQILALGPIALPALMVMVIGTAFYSIYVTHRIAGPIYRLQQVVLDVGQGNLTQRIRFRKSDEMHEIADATNQAISALDQALTEIRNRGARGREALQRGLEDLKAHPTPSSLHLDQFELALKEIEHVHGVLNKFRLTQPG